MTTVYRMRLGPYPYDAKPVPVLHCAGWYDNLLTPHMEDFTELAKRPGWAATQYLYADADSDASEETVDGTSR